MVGEVIYISDKINKIRMWSVGTKGGMRRKEVIEAVVAVSIVLLFEFAAPAIALGIGTMGVGDIVAAATFAAGFGEGGVAFWGGGFVGNCAYSIYLGITHGWGGAFNSPYPWFCTFVTVGIA